MGHDAHIGTVEHMELAKIARRYWIIAMLFNHAFSSTILIISPCFFFAMGDFRQFSSCQPSGFAGGHSEGLRVDTANYAERTSDVPTLIIFDKKRKLERKLQFCSHFCLYIRPFPNLTIKSISNCLLTPITAKAVKYQLSHKKA